MNKVKHSRKDSKEKEENLAENVKKSLSSESSEESEYEFPSLSVVDDGSLHCFTSFVARNQEEGLKIDDLDGLQPELECLLSSLQVRARIIEEDLLPLLAKSTATSKKFKVSESKKSSKEIAKIKYIKTEVSSGDDTDSSQAKKLKLELKSKSMKEPIKTEVYSGEESGESNILMETETGMEVESPAATADDLAEKFWCSVEPYVSGVTQESIRFLRDAINTCSRDMEGIEIPPLGPHYAAVEDEDRRRLGQASPDHTSRKKPRERLSAQMAHRAVTALVEGIPPVEPLISKLVNDCYQRLPRLHSNACLDRKIRRESELLSTLDADDSDQILDDLRECDQELKRLAARNKQFLSNILVVAEKELTRQDVQEKIKTVDSEILDLWVKVNEIRVRKKKVPNTLKKQAWRALKERSSLYSTLSTL